MIRLAGQKMVMDKAFPERDYDIAALKSADSHVNAIWVAPRTGKEHFTYRSLIANDKDDGPIKYLTSKALATRYIPPRELMKPLKGIRLVAEYLFLVRPLLYLVLVRNFGRLSKIPWILSFFAELFSYTAHLDPKTLDYKSSVTDLEKDELKLRRYMFFFYMLREPFYSNITKTRIESFKTYASSRMLFSLLGRIVGDYQPLWENHHFYTTAI